MMRFVFLFLVVLNAAAQEVDADLLAVKSRMDAITAFNVDLQLDVDVSFINMPTKYAKMVYQKGKPTKFESTDFVMLPKRGLDFSLQQLFEYPFITVDRGEELRQGVSLKAVNVIPTDKRADFAIATLLLDTRLERVVESEINTKKNGTYVVVFNYDKESEILPDMVHVNFEIERIKIPLNYMGKGAEVDKTELKADGVKTGKIILKMTNYDIKTSL
ncbi:hypothetical protein [Formosa sp. S-31]|uniref:hypothetical protein n=1 Tax=Formosa sp. S-31 TaxID=2790949 RepID=UPI003EB75BB8